jgi:hypothetical protein
MKFGEDLWFKLPFINQYKKHFFYLYEKLILKLPYNTFIAVSDSTKQNLILTVLHLKRLSGFIMELNMNLSLRNK